MRQNSITVSFQYNSFLHGEENTKNKYSKNKEIIPFVKRTCPKAALASTGEAVNRSSAPKLPMNKSVMYSEVRMGNTEIQTRSRAKPAHLSSNTPVPFRSEGLPYSEIGRICSPRQELQRGTSQRGTWAWRH